MLIALLLLSAGRPEAAGRREDTGVPTADGRLEQLESRLAELEAQNCLLEKQRAETEKELVKEKHGKERATFYIDSFVFGLMGTLLGLRRRFWP